MFMNAFLRRGLNPSSIKGGNRNPNRGFFGSNANLNLSKTNQWNNNSSIRVINTGRERRGEEGRQRFVEEKDPVNNNSNTALKQSNVALIALLAAAAGGGYYYYSTQSGEKVPAPGGPTTHKKEDKNPKPLNYDEVYAEIEKILEKTPNYDDGSYGPILVRLAWHASGTFDKASNNGGSNKATMRFKSESQHGGNAGLDVARDLLEPIHQKHPQISYGDLWTLAGVCAIQQMGGPTIPWRPGRVDGYEGDVTPDGRLPDGSKDAKHVREIFYRMGFDDKEIVALSGAHALGRCHTNRSGFDGPWTPSPTMVTNDYYKQLLEKTWVERKWKGPRQFEDKETKELMMLPTDIALITDPKFKPYVQQFAKDEEAWRKEFSKVISKLFELGVPYKEGTKYRTFKTIE
eukprot:TRINITY_DN143_c0_g1_i1.p1 TRINITY_DN143_c0_g1~~TRINITY_DN143_c0_g1_i1.p1  ORF type:complete len:403 (+),score=152.91 TRINITY_DN143_c0_g1_i1:90-1298(+)